MFDLKHKERISCIYLSISLAIAILNSPLSVLGTFFNLRDVTTYFVLLSWWVLDISFVLLNIKNIKFNRFEIFLILALMSSVLIGVTTQNQISRNYITDITNPLFFILKICLIRQYLNYSGKFKEFFKGPYFNKLVKYSLISSIITIILYIFLSKFRYMYVGLTPLSHPILIFGLIKGNWIYQISAFLIIIFSGKRALLLSSIIMLFVFRFIIQQRLRLLIYLALSVFTVITLLSIFNFNLGDIPAIQKYQWTYETFQESDVEIDLESGILDIISGGRLSEINGALKEMKPLDYFIGKGIGFTYTFSSDNYDYEFTGYNNLHFTPLSLTTKYGLIFYVLLMSYFINCIARFKRTDLIGVFFGLYVIGSLIDMFFAYIIFVDPILPIAIGYLSSRIKTT